MKLTAVVRWLALSVAWITCLGCNSSSTAPPGLTKRVESSAEPAEDEFLQPSLVDPAEVIRAAIEAHGGEEKFPLSLTGKATMVIDGMLGDVGLRGNFTKTDVFRFPDQLRRTVTGKAGWLPLSMVNRPGIKWMVANRLPCRSSIQIR